MVDKSWERLRIEWKRSNKIIIMKVELANWSVSGEGDRLWCSGPFSCADWMRWDSWKCNLILLLTMQRQVLVSSCSENFSIMPWLLLVCEKYVFVYTRPQKKVRIHNPTHYMRATSTLMYISICGVCVTILHRFSQGRKESRRRRSMANSDVGNCIISSAQFMNKELNYGQNLLNTKSTY